MGIDAKMYVEMKKDFTDRQILRLSYDLASAFGPGKFFIDRKGKYHDGKGRHVVTRESKMTQDGPDILPAPGSTYLQVHMWTRYYGEGYERGDLPFLVFVAAFLEQKFPGCTIWYGGDSSGVLLERFTKARREKLFAHFATKDDNNYSKGFDRVFREGLSRHCDFCDEPMMQNGFGGSFAAFHCPGCGFSEETHDKGKTWGAGKEP